MIEETLGVQLFSRENRQTLPTAIGLTVIEQARTMLGALETIRSTVDSTKDIQRGTIRLASFPMVLATFLPPLLRQFNRLYPVFRWSRWKSVTMKWKHCSAPVQALMSLLAEK